MEYIWIIMLVIVWIEGWIVAIKDVIECFYLFDTKDVIDELDSFTVGWIVTNIVIICGYSVALFLIKSRI